MPVSQILIGGEWRHATYTETFKHSNPSTGEALPGEYPVSQWADVDAALSYAVEAAAVLRTVPFQKIADFLNQYASRIEARAAEFVDVAHAETGLAKTPRLSGAELPRTVTQLRQAAAAAVERSWTLPTIDTKNNIRSYYAAVGPVLVMGPNNFPYAFNGLAGGDFAAALAAGCPVIGKAHPTHPRTSEMFAQEAFAALEKSGLPKATVQMFFRTSRDTGLRIASDHRLGSLAFTGSRSAGMEIKKVADAVGKPVFLEMSSLNPLLMLPGALNERLAKLADEFTDSALMGNGQFCTNPGLTILLAGAQTNAFIAAVKERYEARKPSALLSTHVLKSLSEGVKTLAGAGAKILTGGAAVPGPACAYQNTLLQVDGEHFLSHAEALQTEAFGNAQLMVVAKDVEQMLEIIGILEGNLTGCIYSDTGGSDDALAARLEPALRCKVGRLLNDKMPTGVALSPAMNHGGPFPATGHPGFSAVGLPGTARRFTMLQSYDGVRQHRLPAILQNKNPDGKTMRYVDGQWTTADVAG